MKTTSLKILPQNYRKRRERLCQYLQEQKLSGAVLFERDYILYYTGFAFIPTERPVALVFNTHQETALFVPRLELEHARSSTQIGQVIHYIEYPDNPRPETVLETTLSDMGLVGRYGADHDGYPWILGYRGPTLSEMTGHTPVRVSAFIEDQMMIKDQAEIALIRESVKWGNLAHTLLQRYTRVGVTETEASMRASQEATLAMLDAIGPIYRAQSYFASGASAGYRGQIGRNAAIPHALANNLAFQSGDVLVSGAAAAMWGYTSELERTMLMGPATDQQKRMFEHMLALQTLAIEAIQPGEPCAHVDQAVRAYYQAHDLFPFWKHHSGHAIGLRYHEAPYLDHGDQTVIQSGMVFTVEPGLYSPELGGFRHSDTVLVTPDGTEVLTYYPRDLESLTIPV